MNLLEAYKDRLAVSEKVYAKAHNGESMSNFKKIATAKCLENLNRFMNEAFANSTGTQRSDMGMFKKFTLNLTTVAVPNLIAYDLVIVYPMSSISGYVNYIQYTAGSNKGDTAKGDVLNNPFRLGKVDTNYTSEKVVETVKVNAEGKATVAWFPVVEGTLEVVGNPSVTVTSVDTKTGEVVFAGTSDQQEVKVRYVYDNVIIPQNDLPILNAEMANIPLTAKTRRIAVYYSQIAAYQAKQDYGFDLADQLAQQAVGQLNYEIDTEVCQLLIDNADSDADLVWSKTLPVGVSKQEHYAAFTEVIEIAKQKVYDRTKRYAPNYMLIASNLMPILSFIPDFSKASTSSINGPYFAGTLDGIKVYVTPAMEPGKFVLGVHQGDFNTSAAVYAPYLVVTPTQLLQFADGANSQGWSTVYGLEMLNKQLLISGRITA